MGCCAGKSKKEDGADGIEVVRSSKRDADDNHNNTCNTANANRVTMISGETSIATGGYFSSAYMREHAAEMMEARKRRREQNREEIRRGLNERTDKLASVAQDGEVLKNNARKFSLLSELILENSRQLGK